MKKSIFYLTITLFSFSTLNISAQVSTDEMDPDQFVFWFYIRAEVKIDRETKRPAYVVRPISKTPKSGSALKYRKDLWRCLQGGQQITVGPFLDFNDAKRAIDMYGLLRLTEDEAINYARMLQDSTENHEFYWFNVKFKISNRTKKYVLTNIPARADYGDLTRFNDVLWVVLVQEVLAIGPFPSLLEAEESKRLYRLESESKETSE